MSPTCNSIHNFEEDSGIALWAYKVKVGFGEHRDGWRDQLWKRQSWRETNHAAWSKLELKQDEYSPFNES